MAAEGIDVDPDDILVTTGGQQVIDLVCKTLIDPGDVIIAEAPTYPGAVPTFCAYQADVVQIEMDERRHADRRARGDARPPRRARAGAPKFIYTIPTFQNPAGVTMSLPRRQRLVEVARERELLVLEDNPYGLLRYEGEPLPTLRSLDGGDFVIYLGHVLEDPLARRAPRLDASRRARCCEKMNLGKQAADLCSSSLTQLFVAALLRRAAAGGTTWRSLRELYRRRRDVMLDALAEHLPPEATWTHPQGGLFLWATLPDYIDTTDLLARALRATSRSCPGRAAFLDGRGGVVDAAELLRRRRGRHPRGRAAHRRGRRASRSALYGTLTGHRAGRAPPSAAGRRADAGRCADVLQLPAPRARAGAPTARRMTRVAVLKGGRSLERQVSLRSGARVEDALERLGHEVVGIDVGHDLVERLRDARAGRRVRRAARRATARTARSRSCSRCSASPTPARACRRACAARTRSLAKHLLRDAGHPDAGLLRVHRDRVQGARRRRGAAARSRSASRFPIVVKPAGQGSALGITFARTRGRRARARSSPRSPTARKVLLERHVAGRDLAVSVLGGEALPVVEAVPREEDFYDFEARYEIGRTRVRLPGRAAATS